MFKILRECNRCLRPDWERCNALIDGGTAGAEEKWRDLMANKSSIEILDTLINELDGTNKKDFVGLVILIFLMKILFRIDRFKFN